MSHPDRTPVPIDRAAGTANASGAVSPATSGADVPPGAFDPGIVELPFDRALAELQGVVGRLEAGGLTLEDSIVLYERGVALHDRCTSLLSAAELRVQRLVDAAGGPRTLDLRPDDDEG